MSVHYFQLGFENFPTKIRKTKKLLCLIYDLSKNMNLHKMNYMTDQREE